MGDMGHRLALAVAILCAEPRSRVVAETVKDFGAMGSLRVSREIRDAKAVWTRSEFQSIVQVEGDAISLRSLSHPGVQSVGITWVGQVLLAVEVSRRGGCLPGNV